VTNASFHLIAKKYLRDFGNYNPDTEQISKVESLLNNSFVKCRIFFHDQLTKQEINCLMLAAHGKTSQETAALLNISKDTVESHRKEIRRKLQSSSMAHAVYQGIRYGHLKDV
jgi:DNA-binding CsgD family transcriptional regulator